MAGRVWERVGERVEGDEKITLRKEVLTQM